ncbi:MAG: hypothetical protein JW996_05320, partial [Candidatus Cloacimonetes bacterium]|nr:hypothetical protein [Candidatus Cloacimonadota bacterium]
MGRKVKLTILIFLSVILLLGCSTEGKIKIINRTQHNLYFSVKGEDYILEGATPEMLAEGQGNSRTISIDTGNKFLFTEPDSKKVKVDIEGETFALPED